MLKPNKENPDKHLEQWENVFLSVIFETIIDGFLIVNERGEIVKSTLGADKICSHLMPHPSKTSIPKKIWQMCEVLIRSRQKYSNIFGLVEEEISTEQFPLLYIRACWLSFPTFSSPYILIMIEDKYSANCSIAMTESIQYELTPRESEVWKLFRNRKPYKEIANKLFISLDTVKKHLKNIRIKKRMFYY